MLYLLYISTPLFFPPLVSYAETNYDELRSPLPSLLPPGKRTCTQWGLSSTFLFLFPTDWP